MHHSKSVQFGRPSTNENEVKLSVLTPCPKIHNNCVGHIMH